ncbi:MAG: chorismate synthase [Acholeplasmatales bacterium]|jgi:chorismate synthase|nr:chorismate synthase [Acholeplasmatales bacterium]
MNTYGNIFKVTIFGESHSSLMGVVLDGVKGGIRINLDQIKEDLVRRQPQSLGNTLRREKDDFEIISGVLADEQGFLSTGAPITILLKNNNINSKSYEDFKFHYRPSQTDLVAKYRYDSYNDSRGSGIFSARLTALLTISGSIAKMVLDKVIFTSEITELAGIKDSSLFPEKVKEIIDSLDSIGGRIKVTIKNYPIGIGNPYFSKLSAELAHILFSIPAVKGVNFGDILDSSILQGSLFNDLILNAEGKTETNHAGGIVGGISNGNDIVINCLLKPIASIRLPQKTYNDKTKKMETLVIAGRHDSYYIDRARVILENACAIVLLDQLLLTKALK